jgi:hypothetical protein
VIIGARDESQLKQNLGAAEWNLSKEQVAKLDAVSDVVPIYPYWHQRQFATRNPLPIPESLTARKRTFGQHSERASRPSSLKSKS